MTFLETGATVTASIVPFDPTMGVAAFASVALALIVGAMLLLTFTSTASVSDAPRASTTHSNASAKAAETDD